MKVTLDTNILVQDFWFESPQSKIFFDELNIIPATLHIPEIVIDETVNKYREFLTEKILEQKKINSELSKLLNAETINSSIDIKLATDKYKEFILDKFNKVNAQILPYPQIEHKDVVKRILERHRPFKKGDAGYRDFLIWQTIRKLEIWGTEEIVFITNNTKDFGESGFLSDEFVDKPTGNKNFKISVAISKFNDEYVLPRLKRLDELKFQLNKGQVNKFNFKHWLDTEFIESIKEIEFEEVLTGFPYGVGRVRANEILIYDDFKITEVNELNSGEKLVHFNVKCKISASVDISWDDFINHKEVREYYGDNNDEFSFLSGADSGNIEVEGYLILNSDNEEVNEFEITLLEGPGGSIEMGI
jgi:predicted nucleic acid-binding protein